MKYACHHTAENLQSFAGRLSPNPSWVWTENVKVSAKYVCEAKKMIADQRGPTGIEQLQ